jgi:hypothetical protein
MKTPLNRIFLSILLSGSILLIGCNSTTSTSTVVYQSTQVSTSQPPPRPSYSFPSTRVATGNNVFIFDPNHVMWGAYDRNGQLVNQGRASGGKGYCADVGRRCKTPIGTFRVSRKGNASCVSSKFPVGEGGAPMPYCMFFHHGYAIHGSPDVPHYNASHGCIRVLPSDARWLSNNFIYPGTTVIVKPY